MTEHHLLSPYNWICEIFSKFVMVNSNDKKEWAGERSSTLSQVYLPFFQLICFKHLLKVSVLSGSLTSLWRCMLAWTLVLVPSFFFSPLLGCFLSTFSHPFLGAFFL
jgi:hypothetical protein